MKYCDKCKVSVRGNFEHCPLCQRKLSGKAEAYNYYPEIVTVYKQYQFFFKLLILTTIIIAVICLAINLILPQSGRWSFFVVVGILCFWISFMLAIRNRKSLPQSITYQAVIMSALSVVWDFITGWGDWSLNYAVPIIFIITLLSMAILAKVMNIPAGEYLICMIVNVIFGFVPVIFYAIGLITTVVPSVICISCSIISLATMILFKGEAVHHEIVKRFHI